MWRSRRIVTGRSSSTCCRACWPWPPTIACAMAAARSNWWRTCWKGAVRPSWGRRWRWRWPRGGATTGERRARVARRALELVENLLEGARTPDLGETLAMALAEVGDYDRAASIQRAILAVVRRGGSPDAAQRLERNLRLYETRRPTRTFWESDGLTPPS